MATGDAVDGDGELMVGHHNVKGGARPETIRGL